jgi:tRNASer (uridine44-2'-O)-methyltransferase
MLGQGMEKVEDLRVRLMPKQPKRDGKLDQRVIFYRSKEGEGREEGERVDKGVVVMIPLVKNVEEVPFFHPRVRRLVFYYQTEREESCVLDKNQVDDQVIMTEGMEKISIEMIDTPEIQGRISVSYLPFPSTSTFALSETTPEAMSSFLGARRTSLPRKRSPLAGPAPPPAKLPTNDKSSEQLQVAGKGHDKVTQARLDRTCLALLERVYKHGFGQMVGYKKRVNHDVRIFSFE